MKKALCVCLALVLLLAACAPAMPEPEPDLPSLPENLRDLILVLPEVEVTEADWGDVFEDVSVPTFTIIDRAGGRWWGMKYLLNENNDQLEMLIDIATGEEIPLRYPEGYPQWFIASGSYLIMQDRYIFQWKGYDQPMAGGRVHVKLTRIDVQTGEVTVVDERVQGTPFVHLTKLDDERFLSTFGYALDPDSDLHTVVSIAEIHYMDGASREIVRETFESDNANSSGMLLERFAVNNGVIYGFSRSVVAGEDRFYLHRFDDQGDLLGSRAVPGFERIFGTEALQAFYFVGDYIMVRNWESLTNYIVRLTEPGAELVMKGMNGDAVFVVSGSRIFFMESNLDFNAVRKEHDIALFSVCTASGELHAANFPVPLDELYFRNFQALSNGDLLISYETGSFDLLSRVQFVLARDEIHALFDTLNH